MKETGISQQPFPNSSKVFIPGKLHPIQVAMREITLSPTKLSKGGLGTILLLPFTIRLDHTPMAMLTSIFAKA